MTNYDTDMQRFQLPYNLKEIPEVQEYLQFCFEKSKHHGDLEDLYRRRFVTNSVETHIILRYTCKSSA